MADRRLANREWIPGDENGNAPTWERVNTALLLDLRDELRRLNRAIYCPNFQRIPDDLRRIRRNTTKKRKKRRAKP